jgi:hypothetical protein
MSSTKPLEDNCIYKLKYFEGLQESRELLHYHYVYILSRVCNDYERGFDWKFDLLNSLIQLVTTLY